MNGYCVAYKHTSKHELWNCELIMLLLINYEKLYCSLFSFFNNLFSFIGYGNVAPSTEWGKITTIFYAIVGMPLFLLYLSNIGNSSLFKQQIPSRQFCSIANNQLFLLAGDILAKSFKWIYAKCCLCRICPKIARRRMMRERRKLRLQTVDRDFPVNLLFVDSFQMKDENFHQFLVVNCCQIDQRSFHRNSC